MSFEPQIVARAERTMVRAKANGQTMPLGAEELVAKFEQSGLKGKPSTLNFTADPEAPVIFLINKGNQQLFHPATGEPLGKGAEGLRRFFQINLSLHRWLTWPAVQTGEGGRKPEGGGKKAATWKDVGGQINAAGTLAFLFLLFSGLFLWIPKKRTWAAFKTVLTLQTRLKGRARDWNWHNLAGFWASPFILLIAVTGVIMFYPWANKLLFSAFGEQPPAKREAAAEPKTGDQRPPVFAAIETADIALMKDDLSKVADTIVLGRRTLRVIQFNIAFAIAIKVVFLSLAVVGKAGLWLAILADTGATLIVILNSLRLLKEINES